MAGIQDLLNAVGITQKSQDTNTTALTGIYTQQKSVADIMADTYNQSATDSALIQQQIGTSDLKRQNARFKIANMFGTDTELQTEVISGLAADKMNAYKARQASLAEIERKNTSSFFDNPLEFIMNKLTVNDDIERHNAADERYTNADSLIKSLNEDTQTTIKTSNQLTESLTSATVEAASRNAAAAATIEANKATIAGLGYGADGIKAIMSKDKEQLANMFQVNAAKNAEEHLKISLANLDLSRQKFENEKQEFAERMAAKKDSQDLDSSLLTKINAGLLITGQKPLEGVNGKQAIALLKAGSDLGKEYLKYYQMGSQSEIAGTPVVATSPANAIDVFNTTPIKLSSAQVPVKDFSASILQEFKRQAGVAGSAASRVDLKDKVAVSTKLNEIANEKLSQMASNIKPTDATNLFNIASINSIANNSDVVKSLPVYQKVLAPVVASGVQLTDPNVVFGLVTKAIQDKTISFNDALGLSTIYHVGVGANLATKELTKFGIQSSYAYNTQVNGDIVNLTRPDAVARALNQASAMSFGKAFLQGAAIYNETGTNQDVQGFKTPVQQPAKAPGKLIGGF